MRGPGASAVEERRRAFLGDDLEAPGEADKRDESPDNAWDDGQHDALGEGELYLPRHAIRCWFGGHCVDFSGASGVSVMRPSGTKEAAERSIYSEAMMAGVKVSE